MLVSITTQGTLTLNNDGSFTYTPNAGYFGPDSFTYRAHDGTDQSNPATVTITNVAPTASLNAPGSVNEGSSIALSLTGATDVSSADVAAGCR